MDYSPPSLFPSLPPLSLSPSSSLSPSLSLSLSLQINLSSYTARGSKTDWSSSISLQAVGTSGHYQSKLANSTIVNHVREREREEGGRRREERNYIKRERESGGIINLNFF